MVAREVVGTVLRPGGDPAPYATVEIELVASLTGKAIGWNATGGFGVGGREIVKCDDTGQFSVFLTPNIEIDPANTVYRVKYADRGWGDTFEISVPDVLGPLQVIDLLSSIPDELPTNELTNEIAARIAGDQALDARVDVLELDPTTQTDVAAAVAAEAVLRSAGDAALDARVDTLEADPTTGTALAAEASTRAAADTALDGRLDTLEADPTTGTALAAEAATRAAADTALDGRLDTLEADPTTASALAAHAADTTGIHGIADTAQLATTSSVTAAINAVIDAAPGALDTLNELAAALGDDPNFAATITTALAAKQPLDGDLTAIAALTTTAYGRGLLTETSAATLRTTGELERKQVIDARDYGYVTDGTTDVTTAMTNAIAATPLGGTCVFPTTAANAARISAPVDFLEQRTYMFPLVGRMWTYQYTSPIAGSVKLTAGFSGAAAFRIRGKEITGRTLENDGIHIAGLVVDCGAAPGNMHGLQVEGLCRDLSFADCAMQNAQGTGNGWDFRQGTGSAAPRGIRMERCAAVYADANGFRFNGVTDSYFADLLAVSNAGRGFHISNSGENSFVACRAVFNTSDGFFLDGTISVGLTTLVVPATDRNGQNGILISQSGTQPIQIVAPRLRRDGSTSTSLSYSGLRLTGSAGLEVVPVDVTIPQVSVGVDDGGGGSQTPQYAIRALRAQRLTVHGGDLWGVSGAFSDGGNNTEVSWSKDTAWFTGAVGSKTAATPSTIGAKVLPITGGGTGASTALAARTSLGAQRQAVVDARDYATLQLAVDAAGAAGTVEVAGTINVTGTTLLAAGTELRGVGTKGGVIMASTDICIIRADGGQGQSLRNIKIHNTVTGPRTTYDVEFINPTKTVIEDVEIDLAGDSTGGVRFLRDSPGVGENSFMPTIDRLWVRGGVLRIDGVTDGKVTDSYVWANDTGADGAVELVNGANSWSFTNVDVVPPTTNGAGYHIEDCSLVSVDGGLVDGSYDPVLTGWGVRAINSTQLKISTKFWNLGRGGVTLDGVQGSTVCGSVFQACNKQDNSYPDIQVADSQYNTFLGNTHAAPTARTNKGLVYTEDGSSGYNVLDANTLINVSHNYNPTIAVVQSTSLVGRANQPASSWNTANRAQVAYDNAGTQVVAGQTFTKLTLASFTGTSWDQPNSEFVVPRAGTYLVVGTIRLADASTAGVSFGLNVNSSNADSQYSVWQNSNGNRCTATCSAFQTYAAGDRVRLVLYWDNAASVTINGRALSVVGPY